MFFFRRNSSSKDNTSATPSHTSTPSSLSEPAAPRPPDSDGQQQQQELNRPDPSLVIAKQRVPDSAPRSRLTLTPSLKLLLGGVGFFLCASIITRRALRRRRLVAMPPFYTGSAYHHQPRVNGAIEAVEALNLATINVVSLAMVAVGGTMYALDVNSIDDVRRLVRGGAGVDGTGRTEGDLEQELEEWVASVLDRKERRKETDRTKFANERGKER
jgi:hypothetical protein